MQIGLFGVSVANTKDARLAEHTGGSHVPGTGGRKSLSVI